MSEPPAASAASSDGPRRPARVSAAWKLLGVWAFVDGLVVATTNRSNLNDMAGLILLLLILCQVSLVALWGAMGRDHWSVRLIGVVASLATWHALLGLQRGQLPEWTASWVLQTIAVGAPLLALRSIGIRLSGDGSVRGKQPGRLQFTLAQLLIATMLVAIAAAALRYAGVPPMDLLSLSLGPAAITLVAVWALLGRGHLWVRLLTLALAVPVVGAVVGWVIAADLVPAWAFVAGAMFIALPLVASLVVLRLSGYRLVRH